ncbi:MAG: xanthine dehydrogenase small subunit [Steroidobacteraceae bacterium]
MSSEIRFLLDGKLVAATDRPPTTTVLEYLREELHRTGTKEGCAEGDCGACTVVLGELSTDGNQIRYRAVNSCIRMLPTIDGQELVTVESLQDDGGELHPVQQALVDHHASQCGFCTPGFVMSLFALYLQTTRATREQVLEAISGNLCRCTGYRPIIEAGCRMADYPAPDHWGPGAASNGERSQALRGMRRESALRLPGFVAPRSLEELAATLEAQPEALILAGGTDIGLWVTKQLRDLPPIVYLGEVAELKEMRSESRGIVIGAAVSLAEGWSAIVGAYPELSEIAQRFGSPPVRNAGTLCGNLANGSPIGDAMPILIALGAEIELRCGSRSRQLPLEEFYLGYQRKDLAPGEFLVAVTVPPRRATAWVASYKVSKRFDQDISAVCAAFAVQVRDGQVTAARIAFGGMAAIPARARHAEKALIGAEWTTASIEAAAAALGADFQPLTDLRATAAYRLQVARNLLQRFYLEHAEPALALRTGAIAGSA